MEMADFERLLRVNTLGSAYVTRALLPGMKAAGGGRVLFTSSMAGQVCFSLYPVFPSNSSALVFCPNALACWRFWCACACACVLCMSVNFFCSLSPSLSFSACVYLSVCLHAMQSGSYGYTAYSASKFALVGMAQSLQMEVSI